MTGATAAELPEPQLTQALGAGALRGEEFNSVAEQAPGIIQAIGKEVGVPVGKLKDLAKEGKLTSDILVERLPALRGRVPTVWPTHWIHHRNSRICKQG